MVSRFVRDDAHDQVYQGEAMGRLIVVYEFDYEEYDGENDRTRWTTDVAIEFVTLTGDVEYRWPRTSHRWLLLDAIRFVHSGADEFLEKFLK
jgi:hypothetical protein